MTLVDTWVWISVFRWSDPLRIEVVVDSEDAAACLPVIQEILGGFGDEGAFRAARDALMALPVVEFPMERHRFLDALDSRGAARRWLAIPRSA